MQNRFTNQLLIVIVGLIVYSNTLNVPFVFDDDVNIMQNPLVRGFHYFLAPSAVNDSNADDSVKDFFRTRRIGYLSFALNYAIHGYDVTGYHVFNILVHITNGLLVFWFLTFIFRSPYLSSVNAQEVPVAIACALLFVCHPLQTQAVTYIVQRFASLATLFYLLSVVTWLCSRLVLSNPTKKYALYAASIIAAVCAMMTKEISFTLPVVIVAIEFLFFTGDVKKKTRRPHSDPAYAPGDTADDPDGRQLVQSRHLGGHLTPGLPPDSVQGTGDIHTSALSAGKPEPRLRLSHIQVTA
ncbi:hypothetical protein [Candidatus Magnetobacterium casense]|uniref:Uncharacterized protein n=1 Tax=Candidatus Magnetobacterium casense TaxID=1455061 RepID=A0ABS6S3Y4_9BACT|nr:hypothetical protein [Candidatus Magnetobacterium casensis]MBV6343558.1 hypothetical protein [Candidatus Magnetobacterium casensis]